MNSLNRLGQLSPAERRLLFQAVLLLPVIHVGLFFLDYYRLHRILGKLVPLKDTDGGRSEAEVLRQAGVIARIVAIAAGHGLYRASCLRKSLLVWWFLRGQGIQSNICFGVRMTSDHQLAAHAWVERDGIVINDSVGVQEYYRPLKDVFPPVKLGL